MEFVGSVSEASRNELSAALQWLEANSARPRWISSVAEIAPVSSPKAGLASSARKSKVDQREKSLFMTTESTLVRTEFSKRFVVRHFSKGSELPNPFVQKNLYRSPPMSTLSGN